MKSNFRAVLRPASLILIGLMNLALPARALEIELNFKERKSENPSYDFGGVALQKIMADASAYWENIFPDIDEHFKINFFWKDLDGPYPAVTDCASPGLNFPCAIGLGHHYRIRFDSNFDYDGMGGGPFIDDDPNDHSEYWGLTGRIAPSGPDPGLQQTLALEATGGTWGAPDLLEVGYRGQADPGGGAGSLDLYTVALHEIGQVLGLHDSPFGLEPPDMYLNVEPALISRFTAGASMRVYYHPFDSGHLAVNELDDGDTDYPLMAIGGPAGYRSLPAVVDVLAIASLNGWMAVNLPRKELLYQPASGSTVVAWNNPQNWLGGRVPDPETDAFIRDPSTEEINIGATAEARNL